MQRSIPLPTFIPRPLIVPLVSLAATFTALAAPAEHRPGKLPVLVLPGEVTVEGTPRPDLGRSFGDTITAGLIKSGSFTVIENLDRAADRTIDGTPSPETTLAAIGTDSAAHYAFIPRMIVEGTFHKFSLKKLRVSDGEIIDIYEASASSEDRSQMFELLEQTMKNVYADIDEDQKRLEKIDDAAVAKFEEELDLDPEPPRYSSTEDFDAGAESDAEAGLDAEADAKLRELSGAPEPPAPAPRKASEVTPPAAETKAVRPETPKKHVRNSPPEETTPPEDRDTAKSGPKTAKNGTPPETTPSEPLTEVAEYAGRVRTVNADWDFCIIEVAKSGMLKVDDEILVRSSTSLEPLGKLRVSKVEGRQIVADSVGDLQLSSVRPGFKTYRWALTKE